MVADNSTTTIAVTWPDKPNCIGYTQQGTEIVVDQQPCDAVEKGDGYYLASSGGSSWENRNNGGTALPDAVKTAVQQAILDGSALRVLGWVDEELTLLGWKPPSLRGTRPSAFQPNEADKKKAFEDKKLLKRCSGLFEPTPVATKKQREVDKARNKAVREDWRYVICIDASNPNLVKVDRSTTVAGADPAFVENGTHLFEGRQLEVHVLHGDQHAVTIDLTGKEGTVNHLHVGESFSQAAVPEELKITSKPFAGRATDQTAQLAVTVTPIGSNTAVSTYHEVMNVTAVYRAAIRFGYAALVSPFEREYSARAATDAANNPGKAITLDAGGSSPVFHTEIVTAASVFFTPVYQGEGTVTGGALFGLGLLATGGDAGFAALTSVHVGLELDVGRDFSLAAVMAIRRTNVLKDGYFVGRAVADEEQFTRLGFRPSFGLMMTWSPAFTQAFGKAKKAK
ncbi:hypothetical protein [Enhygromyxa salina]|uniref:hypothetical protein n=1 Tax=Enhygromyxa salina TaxID=215803 RepID=UPI0011BA92C7|nr:hypothetical protein [Enhygromyxa salina]